MFDYSCSRIVVEDIDAAQHLAIELLRNVLVARPQANILVIGVENWSKLQDFLTNGIGRYGASADISRRYWDACIIGDENGLTVDDEVRLVIALPGTRDTVKAQRRVEIDLGSPVGEVVVVPGTARMVNGAHVLTAETFGRLKKAEKIATEKDIRALILSGWNGRIEHCQSEAVQMLNAWRGPQVPVILDEAARTTAENALWSARLTEALGGVRRVRVVTAWVSSLRVWLASVIAFRGASIVPVISVVWGRVQAASWRPAILGLIYLRRHIRVGRAAIANGVDHS